MKEPKKSFRLSAGERELLVCLLRETRMTQSQIAHFLGLIGRSAVSYYAGKICRTKEVRVSALVQPSFDLKFFND